MGTRIITDDLLTSIDRVCDEVEQEVASAQKETFAVVLYMGTTVEIYALLNRFKNVVGAARLVCGGAITYHNGVGVRAKHLDTLAALVGYDGEEDGGESTDEG